MVDQSSPRIVSLLPAATEIVVALGFADNLVGRSHECDFPSSITSLPVCTHARLNPVGSSREIDDAVKDALRNVLSIYEVLGEVLADVKPDIIITQDQCEVCAVALSDVELAAASLIGNAPQIISLNPIGLAKVYQDIQRVADALDAPNTGQSLIARFDDKLESVAAQVSDVEFPTVCCVEWADPLMAAGNWVPELVTAAGGRDVFGEAGKHAPWLNPTRLIEVDPDVIVFMPCGFGLDRSIAEAQALIETPEWQALSAVKSGRVFATDGNSFFNRPGPRLIESVDILSEIFHPSLFGRAHQGSAWVSLADLA